MRASRYREIQLYGPHRQRGAAAVFAAISLIAGLIALGLAIDLGRLYYAQRDLQRLSNLAALDAARAAGGCLGTSDLPEVLALNEARASVLRNGGQADWVQGESSIGELDVSGGLRHFVPVSAPPDLGRRAVEVQMERTAPARLIPFYTGSERPLLRARAAALSSPRATLLVGSLLADISDNAPLNALYSSLFGTPFNLSLATYQGLANTSVPIGELLDALGVDPTTPLSERRSTRRVLQALASVANSPQLDAIAAPGDVALNEVFGIDQPVAGSVVNAGQLLTAVGEASAQQEGAVPLELPIAVNGLLDTLITVVSPGLPVPLAPGGIALDPDNVARNTQVRLETTLQIPNILGMATSGEPLRFVVEAARAEAEVDNIHCARRGDGELTVDRVDVSAQSDAAALRIPPTRIMDLNVLGIGRVEVTVSAEAPISAASSANDPPGTWEGLETGEVRTLHTNAVGLQAALDIEVCVKPLLLPRICGPSAAALLPGLTNAVSAAILTPVNNLVTPLLAGLGVNVAGADVSVVAIDADEPLLFTH